MEKRVAISKNTGPNGLVQTSFVLKKEKQNWNCMMYKNRWSRNSRDGGWKRESQ